MNTKNIITFSQNKHIKILKTKTKKKKKQSSNQMRA